MTTAVMNNRTMVVGERPRRSLEELVDRVMDALFASNREQSTAQSVTKRVHDARRLRKAGNLDGALAVFASVEPDKTAPNETRLGLRRVAGPGATTVRAKRDPGLQPGHWQGCGARSPRRRDRGSPGRAGDGVAAGQGGLREEPAGPQDHRRWIMVVANRQVDLEALKSRHSLADVVEAAGVQLRGRGRVRQGVCPFHQESEGSFTVYADTSRFYCFGCGVGGDVLDFIQRAEGLTLPEAIQRLGGGTGLAPSPAVRSRTQAAPRRTAAPVVPQRDPALLTAATRFYLRSMLRSSEAREYLASRGVGFDTGDGLRQYLEAYGFGGERIRASGLFTERGERFAGMVVVPDLASGRVRWLVGRAIDPERSPRFQALPGPKPVLGLGRLGLAPSWAVVAEGLFDWLALDPVGPSRRCSPGHPERGEGRPLPALACTGGSLR